MAHEARVAAAAERERERIEQDRFAGAGLAGQHREAGREIDVEPFDQDDVANRETGEHCSSLAAEREALPKRTAFDQPWNDVNGPARAWRDYPDAKPSPTLLNARLIQEPWSSCGSSPPPRTSA